MSTKLDILRNKPLFFLIGGDLPASGGSGEWTTLDLSTAQFFHWTTHTYGQYAGGVIKPLGSDTPTFYFPSLSTLDLTKTYQFEVTYTVADTNLFTVILRPANTDASFSDDPSYTVVYDSDTLITKVHEVGPGNTNWDLAAVAGYHSVSFESGITDEVSQIRYREVP